MTKFGIVKIVSGGQTGVDRAAFDFALENDFEIGGYVPKDRIAEDGIIDEKYVGLIETETSDYSERTARNVADSDATLILSNGSLAGGSKLTSELAEKYRKPHFYIDFSKIETNQALSKTSDWLSSINCEKLNVAGPRASEDAGIYDQTKRFLTFLFD